MPARSTPRLEHRRDPFQGRTPMTIASSTAPSPKTELFKRHVQPLSLFDRSLIVPAIWGSFRKLNPRTLIQNPVMFVGEIVSVLPTIFFLPAPTFRCSPVL